MQKHNPFKAREIFFPELLVNRAYLVVIMNIIRNNPGLSLLELNGIAYKAGAAFSPDSLMFKLQRLINLKLVKNTIDPKYSLKEMYLLTPKGYKTLLAINQIISKGLKENLC